MVKTNTPIRYDVPVPRDPRGRQSRKVLTEEEVSKLTPALVMDVRTFIHFDEKTRSWLYNEIRAKRFLYPGENRKYEDIFYMSLAEKNIITVRKWMAFLHSGGRKLLSSDPKAALEKLELPSYAGKVLEILMDCEVQRWYETYFIDMILKYGRCGTKYPGYNPDTAVAIASKYGLMNIPCATDDIVSEEPSTAPRRRGRPSGIGTIIDRAKIEELRTSLMKCKTPMSISKEFGVTDQSIHNHMKTNEFIGSRELTQTLNIHRDAIMRLIANGETTWEYYVRIRAICEKSLMKAIQKADPSFVMKYKVVPTKPSILFDYNTAGGSPVKLGQAYGVTPEIAQMWLDAYDIGRVVAPKPVLKTPGERRGGVVDEDIFMRLGIDPNYDPLHGDKNVLKRGDMLR